jgi:hypothetical protein
MVYLDDFVCFSSSPRAHADAMHMVVMDLLAAGWPLSVAKCGVVPSPRVVYLGIDVDVAGKTFALPIAKIEQLVSEAASLLRTPSGASVPADAVEAFAGRANFARLVVPRAGLFLVHLYAAVARATGRDAISLHDAPDVEPERVPPPTFRRSGTPAVPCELGPGAREELAWWRDVAPARLTRRAAWHRLAVARVWAAHGAPLGPSPVICGRSDASDTGIGASWTWGDGLHGYRASHRLADLLPSSLRGASSTARELYGAARLVEALPHITPGSIIRIVLDSQSAVATVRGGGACLGTVTAARRLDRELARRDVDAVVEWAPRTELVEEDADSRRATEDASHATLSERSLAFLCRWAFGRDSPCVDVFASEAGRVARVFGSRWPCAGSVGDGVALLHALADAEALRTLATDAHASVWAYPPFGLARPAVVASLRSTSLNAALRLLLLLPQSAHLHHCLMAAGWSSRPGPRAVRLPSGEYRVPGRPLVAYASPGCGCVAVAPSLPPPAPAHRRSFVPAPDSSGGVITDGAGGPQRSCGGPTARRGEGACGARREGGALDGRGAALPYGRSVPPPSAVRRHGRCDRHGDP